MKFKKLFGITFIIISIFLLGITVYGIFNPNDYRKLFSKKTLSYRQTLQCIDNAFKKYGKTVFFLKEAVECYNKGIVYIWPSKYTKISFKDNYILNILSYFDNLFYKIKLTKNPHLFSEFQSCKYERALGRGFGICSQNALGLADLLYKKYKIETHIIELHGHVVLEAVIKEKKYILDPSVGLFIPYNLNYIEKHLNYIFNLYKNTNHPELAKTYQPPNEISPIIGSYEQTPRLSKLECWSDVLKWIIPIFLFILGLILYKN